MKKIKYILISIFVLGAYLACTDDNFDNTDFLSSAKAPANVSALFQATQDNSGLVKITPNSEGAAHYNITFGDNTAEPGKVVQGKSIDHVYAEGTYTVTIEAIGITGLSTEVTHNLVVSFNAPENLEVNILNDAAVSKKVNVTVTADFAINYDVYFGEPGNDVPVTGNIGNTVSYTYQEAGTYTIRIEVKGAAIETTEYIVEFEVTAILQPITSAPTPPARSAQNVISIFSPSYNDIPGTDFNPDWGQSGQGSGFAMFNLNGDDMLNYINLSYQGIQIGQAVDLTNMEYLHMDIWTADLAQIRTFLINVGVDPPQNVLTDLTADAWTSVDIPMSAFTDQGVAIDNVHQFKFVSEPWLGGSVFIDNIYFWKQPEPASGLEGIWKLAPEAGALKVGPTRYDGSWWSNSLADVTTRACLFDDEYVFNLDGSFQNIQDAETWLEPWQGFNPEQCGSPVAPHNGSNPASFVYDAGANTITLNGVGAYLGIAKVTSTGELSSPGEAPASITYDISLQDNNNTMIVDVNLGWGYWTFKLVRHVPPIAGSWKLAPEAGALKVGPGFDDGSWWSNSLADVSTRACLFDDEYVFGSDGSFMNVLGSETWLEPWQGFNPEQCGTPIAPHNGQGSFTYNYDESGGTITLNGTGAYLGIAKVTDTGELGSPGEAPSSITYQIEFIDNNTIRVWVDLGWGFWTYKLVKN
ncbi:hypothetical protein OE09_0910 [Flavobacteriaceae bacterium MAR_2010_72]|nr:hypothetical protein OE09_0910 [Flavobacteriaceae bacterium MAR_2010_72]